MEEKEEGIEPLQIIIEFDTQKGAVGVTKMPNDPILCYGLLEVARQIVQNTQAQRARQAVRPIQPSEVPPNLRAE